LTVTKTRNAREYQYFKTDFWGCFWGNFGLVIGSSPREVDLGTFTAIVTEEEPLRGKPIVRFSKDKDIGAKREQLIRTTTEQPLRG
jgi:ABC-type sugar transport system permease subunit